MKQRIILAGGSGFLGRMLQRFFLNEGMEVVVLSRQGRKDVPGARVLVWDGETLGEWWREFNRATAIINLAGRSVNCRYTPENREMILNSRIRSTRVLAAAIRKCEDPPGVWLNSITATIYKHSYDVPMNETTGENGSSKEAKDKFSVFVAREWESALNDDDFPNTRRIALRTGMLLGIENGGVFRVLRRLVRCGLGGCMAGGRQYVSWIHWRDFCRAVNWLIADSMIVGPVNVVAPMPITNHELMQTFRRNVGIRFGLPATLWMLEVGAFFLRTETELILKSRRVVPGRLLEGDFQFDHPGIAEALRELPGRQRGLVGLSASRMP